MDSDIKVMIEKAVKVNGYTLLDYKRYSKYKDDSHLYTVLAVYEREDRTQYVTWLFNSSTGSLNHGHYMEADKESAYNDYENREWNK